jgi:hypothetical protein
MVGELPEAAKVEMTGFQPSEFGRDDDVAHLARRTLGHPGQMIGGSKSRYCQAYPDRKPVFNANVCTKENGKIWYGDLDLAVEDDRQNLRTLAALMQTKVYVLSEYDARFKTADQPDFSSPRAVIHLDGTIDE